MIIYVDVDGVLCDTSGTDYAHANPIRKNIAKVNKLFAKGHNIIIWTARGGTSGIDWSSLTREQLRRWNVRYHKLRMDKPPFDRFIDDRLLDINKLDPKSI